MTTVASSSVPNRVVCVSSTNSNSPFTVTTSQAASNMATKQGGGVVLIKKGNKINLLHNSSPSQIKKTKLIVPKISKQVDTAIAKPKMFVPQFSRAAEMTNKTPEMAAPGGNSEQVFLNDGDLRDKNIDCTVEKTN